MNYAIFMHLNTTSGSEYYSTQPNREVILNYVRLSWILFE